MARAIGRNFSIAHRFNCTALAASCNNFSSYLVLDIEQILLNIKQFKLTYKSQKAL